MAHHVDFTMSGLLLAGGVAAYAKAKSVPSLVASVGFSALFWLAG